MLETLGFLHISSKNPVDADIANRKHYSAPAGALTFYGWNQPCFWGVHRVQVLNVKLDASAIASQASSFLPHLWKRILQFHFSVPGVLYC